MSTACTAPPAEGAADGSVSFHVTAGSRDAPAVGSGATAPQREDRATEQTDHPEQSSQQLSARGAITGRFFVAGHLQHGRSRSGRCTETRCNEAALLEEAAKAA